MSTQAIHEPGRDIPVTIDCDVLVCGGGVAGVAAALGAANSGAKVCLIEKSYGLGGLATLGLICDFLPLCDGSGHQVVRGIAEQFFYAAAKRGAQPLPECWVDPAGSVEERTKHRLRIKFTPAHFQLELDAMMEKTNVRILFDTRLCNLVKGDNRVTAAIVENKNGRSAIRCKAIVDATGDADAAYLAGEETVSLHDNRRASWFYAWEDNQVQLHIMGDPFFLPVPEGAPVFSGDDANSVTAFCQNSRQLIRAKVEELIEKPDGRDTVPIILPSIPQMRKTRRLRGLMDLTVEDKLYYPDTIGMTGYYRSPGLILCIPYRALIGKKVENLFAAGRCISCREDAWNITRGIPSCSITGQAAGVAAAMSISHKVSAQQLDCTQLQKSLTEQGVYIKSPLLNISLR